MTELKENNQKLISKIDQETSIKENNVKLLS
jgi:hypothetical protein